MKIYKKESKGFDDNFLILQVTWSLKIKNYDVMVTSD